MRGDCFLVVTSHDFWQRRPAVTSRCWLERDTWNSSGEQEAALLASGLGVGAGLSRSGPRAGVIWPEIPGALTVSWGLSSL